MLSVVLLAWLQVCVGGCGACLQCWPSGQLYFDYDAQLLLDLAQPDMDNAEMVQKLHRFFLDPALVKKNHRIQFVEQEQMEMEGGCLFSGLNFAIHEHWSNVNSMFKAMEELKKNYTRKLVAASALIQKQICETPCARATYEVANCQTCERFQATCKDEKICRGKQEVLASISVTLLLLLTAGGIGGYIYLKKRENRRKLRSMPAKPIYMK